MDIQIWRWIFWTVCVCDCVIVLQWVLQWLATMIFQTLTPNRNSSRTRSQVRFHRYSISRTVVCLYAWTHRLCLNSHTNIRFANSQGFFSVHQYAFFRLNHDPLHYQKILNSLGKKKKSIYSSSDFRNLKYSTDKLTYF